MEKEINKLIYEYSINGKIADKQFAEKVIEICINEFNIRDYVEKYDVKPIGKESVLAGYNIGNRSLILDLESIKKEAYEKLKIEKKQGITSTQFLDNFKINSYVVYGIVHELTHASQYKKCLEGPSNLEKELLEMSLERNLILVKNEKVSIQKLCYFSGIDEEYKKAIYFNTVPSERMADIKGLEVIRDISKLIDDELKGNIEEYTELGLIKGKIHAYGDMAPTVFYRCVNDTYKYNTGLITTRPNIDEISKMYIQKSIENNCSLDEKMYFGLPINTEEKIKVYKKIKDLSNKLTNKK